MRRIPTYKLMKLLRKFIYVSLRIKTDYNYLHTFKNTFENLIIKDIVFSDNHRNSNKELYRINVNNFKELQKYSYLSFEAIKNDVGDIQTTLKIYESNYNRNSVLYATIELVPNSCKDFIRNAILNQVDNEVNYKLQKQLTKREKTDKKKMIKKIVNI